MDVGTWPKEKLVGWVVDNWVCGPWSGMIMKTWRAYRDGILDEIYCRGNGT